MQILWVSLILLILGAGCAQTNYPHIWIVKDAAQIGGNLGLYWRGDNTIYLAPGADEKVFWHEWRHSQGDMLGEQPVNMFDLLEKR
jgi:hypothetical protein